MTFVDFERFERFGAQLGTLAKCQNYIYSDFATLLDDLPASLEALKNEILSIDVTYTRKSLVKGERFIRGMSK